MRRRRKMKEMPRRNELDMLIMMLNISKRIPQSRWPSHCVGQRMLVVGLL